MSNHLYSIKLKKEDMSGQPQNLKYLKCFINEDRELDLKIREKLPITYFGSEEEKLRIKGTKTLLEKYDKLDAEKYDFIESLSNVEYIGISHDEEIILNFPEQNIKARGIYDFSKDFFKKFEIDKYAKFCIKNGYTDLVKDNLDKLFNRSGNKEYQYRLLREKNEEESWRIRGLTSVDRYNNYDNSIAIYIALLGLHKYAKEKDIFYYIDKAYISDSSLYIFFEQEKPIEIPDVGKLYLGIVASNGEIRNKAFKVEARYRLVDSKGKSSFSAILDNSIFSIGHNVGIAKVEEYLSNFFKLNEHEQSIIDFISNLKQTKSLSEDATYFLLDNLLERISDCSDISKKTRDGFKEIDRKNIVNNAMTLIEFLGKVESINTDIDEKIFIERIVHKVMIDLMEKMKKDK